LNLSTAVSLGSYTTDSNTYVMTFQSQPQLLAFDPDSTMPPDVTATTLTNIRVATRTQTLATPGRLTASNLTIHPVISIPHYWAAPFNSKPATDLPLSLKDLKNNPSTPDNIKPSIDQFYNWSLAACCQSPQDPNTSAIASNHTVLDLGTLPMTLAKHQSCSPAL
jgi:hypothetical protein